jgi:hypothetical protein
VIYLLTLIILEERLSATQYFLILETLAFHFGEKIIDLVTDMRALVLNEYVKVSPPFLNVYIIYFLRRCNRTIAHNL